MASALHNAIVDCHDGRLSMKSFIALMIAVISALLGCHRATRSSSDKEPRPGEKSGDAVECLGVAVAGTCGPSDSDAPQPQSEASLPGADAKHEPAQPPKEEGPTAATDSPSVESSCRTTAGNAGGAPEACVVPSTTAVCADDSSKGIVACLDAEVHAIQAWTKRELAGDSSVAGLVQEMLQRVAKLASDLGSADASLAKALSCSDSGILRSQIARLNRAALDRGADLGAASLEQTKDAAQLIEKLQAVLGCQE
jgi:hypothetical protein